MPWSLMFQTQNKLFWVVSKVAWHQLSLHQVSQHTIHLLHKQLLPFIPVCTGSTDKLTHPFCELRPDIFDDSF